MTDIQAAADPAADEPAYTYKPSLLGAPWMLRLAASDLVWEVGRHSGRIPYRQISRVRLSFRPATMQTNRFLTEIWSQGTPKLTIASTSWKTMFEQERFDSHYAQFVRELHRRMAVSGGTTEFIAGVPALIYWPGLALFVAAGLGIAALLVRALQAQAYSGATFVGGFFALFVWQLSGYFRRNRPGRYAPDAVPSELLPRG